MAVPLPIRRLFVVGIPGLRLDEASRPWVAEAAGVILFRRNLGTPAQIRALTRDLRAAAGHKLLIAVDQEGGRVRRLPSPPYPAYPAAGELAARGIEAEVEAVAEEVATTLAGLGINTNLAPVLDVVDDPATSVIRDRSFGRDPATVARLGAAWVRGSERGGVVSCLKHFPGHGATRDDSHLSLAVVKDAEATVIARDRAPFAALIDRSIPMVMTAHVRYPAVDPLLPATLSARIVRGWLRDELGFTGVVVSDDLEMAAIARYFSPEAVVRRFWAAGGDLLLVGEDQHYAARLAEAACAALDDGGLPPARVEESLARVARLLATVAA